MLEPKVLPHSIEVEQVILGALLNDNINLDKVAYILREEHFFVPLHQKIYQLIQKIIDKGNIASPLTLKPFFEKEQSVLETQVNGFEYLTRLAVNAYAVVDIVELAKHIHELFVRRQIIRISEDAINDSYQENIDFSANNRIEKVEKALFNLTVDGSNNESFLQLKEPLKSTITRIKEAKKRGSSISGIPSMFTDIDQITGGFQKSDLIIIAARPSMGKTSLAINIAINVAESFQSEIFMQKKDIAETVGFMSLEMSAEQIASRILSIKTGIDGSKVRVGMINKEEFELLTKESAKLCYMPMFIDDTPALSISNIRARSRRMKRQHNLGLLIIDYLQLVHSSRQGRDVNRVQEIGDISQGLKTIAKELDIPVIALSQLSRAVELREDKRPLLSDLRESGNIEQDADLVMFIYREEYYLDRKIPIDFEKNADWQERYNKVKNTAEVIVAKQRNGPTGVRTLRFNAATTSFSNLDYIHDISA